jgi:RHS repeat-associated protein
MVSSRGQDITKPTNYFYDGLDRRDRKTVEEDGDPQRSDLSYVGLTRLLSRETGKEGETKHYDYDSEGRRLGQEIKKGTPFASPEYRPYANDANGSVQGLENSTGHFGANDEDTYLYDPYGENDKVPAPGEEGKDDQGLSAAAKDNPFRFEGFYYDSGVRTYDMQAREYRPSIGRFLAEDHFEAAVGDQFLQADPLTQQRYAFAGGNPVNNVEFDGHMYPKGCFPGRPEDRPTAGGGDGGGSGHPRLPAKTAPQQYWSAKAHLARALRAYHKDIRAEAAVKGKPKDWSKYCYLGYDTTGACDRNHMEGYPDLEDYVREEFEKSVKEQIGDPEGWSKADAQHVVEGMLGGWHAAVVEKELRMGRQLGFARRGAHAAADAGRYLAWARSNDEINRLTKLRRAGEGSWRLKALSGLDRANATAGFLLDVSQGISLPRAAARTVGRWGGAMFGIRAGALCGGGAVLCGAAGGVLGAILGEEAIDAAVDEVKDVTNAPEIIDDLCPGGDCWGGYAP